VLAKDITHPEDLTQHLSLFLGFGPFMKRENDKLTGSFMMLTSHIFKALATQA
jgi:hypothetical protein